MELELENYWANNFTHKYSLGMVFKHRGHHHLRTLPGRKSPMYIKDSRNGEKLPNVWNFHGDPKIEATPKTHLQTAKLPYLLVKTMISYSKPFHFLGPDNTRWGVLPHRRRDTPHRCCLGDKKNVNQRHRRSVSRCFNQKKKELPWYTLVCVCIYIKYIHIYIYIGHIYR